MEISHLDNKMLKHFEDMLRCRICSEYFNSCVMTACSHNFCSACLKKQMETESDCCICFEEMKESELRSNRSMDKMVRIYKKLVKTNAPQHQLQQQSNSQTNSHIHSSSVAQPNSQTQRCLPQQMSPKETIPVGNIPPICNVQPQSQSSTSITISSSERVPVQNASFIRDLQPAVAIKQEILESDDSQMEYIVLVSTTEETNASAVSKEHQLRSDVEMCSDNESVTCESLPPAQKRVKTSCGIRTPSFSAGRITNFPNSPAVNEVCANSQKTSSTACSTCHDNKALLECVLASVTELKQEISYIRDNQASFGQKLDLQTKSVEQPEDVQVQTTEALLLLEQELESNDKFTKMVRNLGVFGGRDCNEVTRRILKSLISSDVALCLNWMGGNGKLGMKTFPRILQMLSAAVRQSPATKFAKQVDVEFIAKRWIRTAPDRNGGRLKRRQKYLDGAVDNL